MSLVCIFFEIHHYNFFICAEKISMNDFKHSLIGERLLKPVQFFSAQAVITPMVAKYSDRILQERTYGNHLLMTAAAAQSKKKLYQDFFRRIRYLQQ